MKENEIGLIENHSGVHCNSAWITIQLFNKITKKKISEYGPFSSVDQARIFAKEHHIDIA